jgi:hypothetical protein
MYTNGAKASMIGSAKTYIEPVKVRKPKMKKPGFFKRWLLGQVKPAHEYDSDGPQALVRESHSIDQPERAIQFTVYNANGGRVVETRRYDRQKDRNHQNLYIITSDQEFGKEIDKIITMEALR